MSPASHNILLELARRKKPLASCHQMDIPSQQECVIEFFRRNGHSQTSAKSLKAAALHHVVEYMTIKRLDESKPTVNDRPTTETPVTTGTSVKTENVSSESNVALQLTLRNAPAVSTAILTDMLDPPTDRFAATAATTSRQSMSDELADSPQSTQSVALKRKLTELEEKVIPESGHVPEKKRTSIGKAIIQDDSHDGATADGAFAATVFSTSEREDTVRYPDTAQLNALLSGLELGASCLDEDESSLTRSIRVQYSEHSECPIATVGFKLAKTRAPEQVSVSSSLAPPTMARPLGAGEAAISTSKVDEPTDYIYGLQTRLPSHRAACPEWCGLDSCSRAKRASTLSRQCPTRRRLEKISCRQWRAAFKQFAVGCDHQAR